MVDGGRDHLLERKPSQALVDVHQALEGARNSGRREPDGEHLRHVSEKDVHRIEVAFAVARRLGEPAAGNTGDEVEEDLRAGSGAREHETRAPEARHGGLHHRAGERRRHDRVEGVAPGAQHVRAGLGDDGVSGREKTLHAGNLLPGEPRCHR